MGGEGALAHATADAPWTDATAGADDADDGRVEVSHAGYAVDVVDTTGAGDAFTAGVIAALSGGESLAEALAFANAVAAVTTTGTGAMTALPTREAVRRLIDSAE
jgi:fructokinase